MNSKYELAIEQLVYIKAPDNEKTLFLGNKCIIITTPLYFLLSV